MAPASTCEEDYQTNNGNSSKKAKNGSKMDSSQKKRKKHARHEELDEHPDDEKTPSRKWKNAISKYQKEEEGTSVKKKMQDPREEEEGSTPMAKEKAIVTSKKKTKSKPKNRDTFTEEVNSEENEVKGKKKKKKEEKEKEKKKKMEEEEEEPSLDYKEEGRPWIVSFQLVVPYKDMGKVIGKQGARVQQLREETGALIKIEDTITNADERVIWMSSKEETLESQSAAERALLNVAKLLTKAEHGDEEVAKLCLKVSIPDSEMVRELQTSTEGVVSVLTRGTDRYVQIDGETGMVRRALEIIAVKLRERRGHGRSRKKKKQGRVRGAVKASAQIHVSKGLVAKVVGKEGATIWRLKQRSGASIEVKDPEDGGKKSIIHVKGTLAQVTRAQTLLQTFLASLTKLKK